MPTIMFATIHAHDEIRKCKQGMHAMPALVMACPAGASQHPFRVTLVSHARPDSTASTASACQLSVRMQNRPQPQLPKYNSLLVSWHKHPFLAATPESCLSSTTDRSQAGQPQSH